MVREERLTIDIKFVQFETNSFVEGIGWEKTRYQLNGEIATASRTEGPGKFADIQLSCLAIIFVKNILIVEAKSSRRACTAQILCLDLSDGTQFDRANMAHEKQYASWTSTLTLKCHLVVHRRGEFQTLGG